MKKLVCLFTLFTFFTIIAPPKAKANVDGLLFLVQFGYHLMKDDEKKGELSNQQKKAPTVDIDKLTDEIMAFHNNKLVKPDSGYKMERFIKVDKLSESALFHFAGKLKKEDAVFVFAYNFSSNKFHVLPWSSSDYKKASLAEIASYLKVLTLQDLEVAKSRKSESNTTITKVY